MREVRANAVYDILVAHAGAPDHDGCDRTWFIYTMAMHGCTEYRFQGSLGGGGKLYVDARRWRVDSYPEHLTDARQAAIDATNAALETLRRTAEADAMWSHTSGVNP